MLVFKQMKFLQRSLCLFCFINKLKAARFFCYVLIVYNVSIKNISKVCKTLLVNN